MGVLGRASGFDEEYVDMLCTASMMHDIGKLMISEEILNSPNKLTDEELKQLLLKKFGSVENIKKASVSEIAEVKGINEKLAEKILKEL